MAGGFFAFACREIEFQRLKGETGMSEYKHPEVLVSTESVAQNLNAPNTRLVEVDVDTTAYDQGHIPGAGECKGERCLGAGEEARGGRLARAEQQHELRGHPAHCREAAGA